MRRYWKFIVVTAFVVLTFGTFYISSSLAKYTLPPIHVDHQNGDPKEIDDLIVRGSYRGSGKNATFEFTKNGATYEMEDRSFYRYLLKGDYLNPEIKRLQKEYRSFMRGKYENVSSYFENDDMLVYGHIDVDYNFGSEHHFTLEIEALNKQTREKNQFSLEIPNEGSDYLNVAGLQLTKDDMIQVFFVRSMLNDLHYHEENMEVYTIDLEKHEVISSEQVQAGQTEQNRTVQHIEIINGREYDIAPKDYLVFHQTIETVKMGSDGHEYTGVDQRNFIRYDIETGKQTLLDVDQETVEGYYVDSIIDNELIFMNPEDDAHHILKYDVEAEKFTLKQTFDLKDYGGHGFATTVSQDKIYFVGALKTEASHEYILVGDLENGDLIYEGTYEFKHKDDNLDYDFYIYDVELVHENM